MSLVIKTFSVHEDTVITRRANGIWQLAVHSVLNGNENATVACEVRSNSWRSRVARATGFFSNVDEITLLIAVRHEICIKCENEVAITCSIVERNVFGLVPSSIVAEAIILSPWSTPF